MKWECLIVLYFSADFMTLMSTGHSFTLMVIEIICDAVKEHRNKK